MAPTIRLAVIIPVLLSAIGNMGCEDDGGDHVTPLDRNNRATFHGTYKIIDVQFFDRSGMLVIDYPEEADVFVGYMAINTSEGWVAVDLYIVEEGQVVVDRNSVDTRQSAQATLDRYRASGDVSVAGTIMVETIRAPQGTVKTTYRKISDSIQTQRFDVLKRASGGAYRSTGCVVHCDSDGTGRLFGTCVGRLIGD